ncbi:MAG TPA: hypothetical protein VFN61_15760 [Acidimicrobiales bacterium]|nr:hypothetical protein [Acidimicrobiales bacterium]
MAGAGEKDADVRRLEERAEGELEEEESAPEALKAIEAVDQHSGKGVDADLQGGPARGPAAGA